MGTTAWKWWSGGLLLVAAAGSLGAEHTSSRDKRIERSATRQGNVIQIHPSEVTFQVPETWRGPNTSFRLTRKELRKTSSFLWGTRIADAPLNLRDCAAQVEPDNLKWLRVYVVNRPEDEILRRILEKGRAAVGKMPNYSPGHSSRGFQTEPAKDGPWEHIDIPYGLNFGDYSEGGYLSFYLRPVAGSELVIVVGAFGTGVQTTDVRQDVVKSVVVPEAAATASH